MLKICFPPHIADCNTHRFSQQTGVFLGPQPALPGYAWACFIIRFALDFTCRRRAHLLGTARNVLLIHRLIFLEMKCSLAQNRTLITGRGDKRGRWGLSSRGRTHGADTTRFCRAFRVNVPLQPSRGSDVGERLGNESERKKREKHMRIDDGRGRYLRRRHVNSL